MPNRQPHVGDLVIWHDPVGSPRNALITAVFAETMVNLVMVSDNDKETDSYGRQIERRTSQGHASIMKVHGNY